MKNQTKDQVVPEWDTVTVMRQMLDDAEGFAETLTRLTEANRELRKQHGKQGDTIYALRCQLDEAREMSSKLDRGELRLAERQIEKLNEMFAVQTSQKRRLRDEVADLRAENENLLHRVRTLEEKLAANVGVMDAF